MLPVMLLLAVHWPAHCRVLEPYAPRLGVIGQRSCFCNDVIRFGECFQSHEIFYVGREMLRVSRRLIGILIKCLAPIDLVRCFDWASGVRGNDEEDASPSL